MTWCDDGMINGLLTQVNQYRAQNQLPALAMDPVGMKDAELRATQFAQYMATHQPGSSGFNPHEGWDTTAASLGYNIVSENLAYMTSDPTYIVYAAWQDSLHIAAMLASDANVTGVSCVYSNGIPYWTYEPGKAQTGGGTPSPTPTTDEQSAFLTLINNYRAQNGAGPLQISPTLQNASSWMANDMATHNYASHTDSLGRSVGTRLAAFGYTYVPYAENIAGGFGDAQTAFTQWRDACDPDTSGTCTYAHRKNMLNASFTAIGIGRAYNANSTYGWYWATDFGGYLDSGTTPTPPPAATPPTISSFQATPTSIMAGQTATLTWSVSSGATLVIDNGVGDVSGVTSKTISPQQTTTYRLTATNAAGSVFATTTVNVSSAPTSDTQPPTAPSVTSVTAKSSTQVDIAWTASKDNVGVAGYQILRNGSPAGSVGGLQLQFSDSVAPSTTYTYTVRAFDAAGNYSPASNGVQVTTPAPASTSCPGPAQGAFTGCYYNTLDLSGVPSLVRADRQINFNWMYTSPAPSVSGSNFSVRWQGSFSFTAGTYTFTVTASDGVRLYIDGGLVLDRWRDQPVYTYTVRPTLSAGTHTIALEYYERSGTSTVSLGWVNGTSTPDTGAPVVSAFTANPTTVTPGQSATLSWAISGATSVTIDNGAGDVSNVTSKVVTPAQTTTYKLTALNAAGSTTASVAVTVNASSAGDTQAPTAPTLTSVVAKAANRVDLTWTASTDNTSVAGYQVIRNGIAVGSVPVSTLSYSDVSVAPSTSYTYAVRAFDAARNYSAASNTGSVTTPAASAGGSNCSPATNAFTGCYYNNVDLSGSPVLIRTDPALNFDWTFSRPDPSISDTNYSVRWQGTFSFDAADYTFYATASDGMRVYIDGTIILDRWRDQPVYSYTIRRTLTPGTHLITVEYYERTGMATARLSWQKN